MSANVRLLVGLHGAVIFLLPLCSEKIFGYRGLEVQVCYTSGGLRTFVGVKYTDKVDPATSGGLKVCGRDRGGVGREGRGGEGEEGRGGRRGGMGRGGRGRDGEGKEREGKGGEEERMGWQ